MNNKERLKLIKEITEVEAISGHEKNASRVFKKYVTGYCDSIEYDNLGSIIAVKKGGKGPKIMICGHIDEIGFMVSKIEKDGFIRLHPVGGWWPHVLLSQRLSITTREGKRYVGIVGSLAPHGLPAEKRAKVMDIKELYVDLGCCSKEEVEKLGIRPGDPITPVAEFFTLANPKFWASKAFDDRAGAAIAIEVLRNLKGVKHPNTLYACGTVQEEVGLRGATTAANYVQPDIAIALDTTLAGDVPGQDSNAKLGKGIAISFGDASVLGHKGLIDELVKIAEKHHIPYSFDMLAAGGTDSGMIHKSGKGVINCTLSIPERYVHAHYGVINETDYVSAVSLLTEFVKVCDDKMYKKLIDSKK